ncbi:G8 domain-containing protein DDB_G0286311-like [Chiloscyllium plagiosum]|uniref:G8 domain-containing protein DDB_G0286311-like n=1 Tax=Chiloscyllium plagiosum TaxID=36176 RepID=UPI001CB82E44|nr:G8 domain-containing protein DDB_G0286311-like [Chiloscyllium plagiosum]
MKIIFIIFAVAQILYYSDSGIPCDQSTNSQTPEAVNATITQVNQMFAMNNLFRIVSCQVLNATDLGEGATDFEIIIDVQETVCAVNSGLDPANCTLLLTPDAKTATCTSQVQVRRNESPVVMVQCMNTSMTTPTPTSTPTPNTTSTPTPTSTPTSTSTSTPTPMSTATSRPTLTTTTTTTTKSPPSSSSESSESSEECNTKVNCRTLKNSLH